MRERFRNYFLSGLFLLILTLILLPALQGEFALFHPEPLSGYFRYSDKPVFCRDSLVEGKFQASLLKYTEDSVPLKPWMIRLYNQIDYSLFSLTHGKATVVGKKEVLFEDSYIEALHGRDFIGEKAIREKLYQLAGFQQFLAKQGIGFLLIFEPSKARFMPENIPDQYLDRQVGKSNYEVYREILDKEKIKLNVIDFNKYFLEQKNKSPYPLYPDHGTHWSQYSSLALVADSVVRAMEAVSGKNMANIRIKKVEWSEIPCEPDDDIYKGLNLFTNVTSHLAYPQWEIEQDGQTWKPDVLVISDSYYWNIYNSRVFSNVFRVNDFWFYFEKRYPAEKYKAISDHVLLKDDLLSHNFIILMMTEIYLPKMWDAHQRILELLDPANPLTQTTLSRKERRIRYYENLIRFDPSWLDAITKKLPGTGRTLDQQIRGDAEFMVEQEGK